jgi:hypothetical protein
MSARPSKVLQDYMIFQRTKCQSLPDVLALNMWGCDLDDVSIISQMPNLETLSLPVNKISTLAPFSGCPNLHSLLLRENEISRIEEINHLQNLPHLITLSLIDNPITEVPNSREIVIRKLPQLRTLDDIPIPQRNRETARQPEPQPPTAAAQPEVYQSREKRPPGAKGKPGDANTLAAVLSRIPELSRDSLRVVLEAIEQRCC